MPRLKIAHLQERGASIIIVPLDGSLRHRSVRERDMIIDQLQARARAAGLAGTVTIVWDDGNGVMGFRGPANQHAFYKTLSLGLVAKSLNRTLAW